ncbi:MAG: carbohydrate ABC transporter permease [Chloroflexi bacterium]|nr:carbohydrate ABC transporter permease [Chloroflexota bacterium]
MTSPRRRPLLGRLVVYGLLLSGLVLVGTPFAYMVSTSLKSQRYTFEYPPQLWPREPTLANYLAALGKDLFGLYFLNSAVVALATTATTVLIAAMLAYAFSRLQFPGRDALFYVLLLGMMIPPVMLIIPQFIIAKQLRLLNSLGGLVAVYVTMNLPMQTFLLRGFFDGIPRDLEDAVLIDGGNRWTVFWKVILPLARPGLAVVAIFTFLYSWDEFPWAHVSIKEATLRTLPVGIALFQNQHLTEWGQVFAASTLAMLPVVILYVVLQRHFIKGLTAGALR